MKDNGVVISLEKDLAKVAVDCLSVCNDCSSRSLCSGKEDSKGILSAKNPLRACPGDEVSIEVPETSYNRALIVIFGTLLIASLVGMAGGSLLSQILSLSQSKAGIIGLFLGLILGGTMLALYFPKKNKEQLYPVITDIKNK